MADASAYQGSQAFNQASVTNELVTRNTGSLNLAKAIVALRGISGGIGLTINLSYAAGSQGLLGLPAGWSFGIAYLVPNASLTSQGKTSIIDPTWTDSTGYQSGLRYVNNHGMNFQNIIPPQPLPSGRPGTYSFRLRYTDGSNDYYDATGKLVEHADLYGNAVTYYYTDPFAGPLSNRLDHILDSFGQSTRFQYGSNSIVVTTPDGAQTTINYSGQGVQNIVDPVGNVTAYTYQSSSGQYVVGTIQYPTGLKTQLEYTSIAYLDASGNAGSFPAVSDLYHLDTAGSILEHTNYAFGMDTAGATFTGISAGYRMYSTNDSLMDSNNTGYQYDVLVRRYDARGTVRSASRAYYNYLHLPLREEHYLVSPTGELANGYRAVYTYFIDPNYHARSTTYTQPVCTEQFVYNAGSQLYRQLRKSTASYDAYGQLLTSEEFIFDNTQQAYVSQLQSALSFTATSWGGELPSLETHTDQVTGFQRQISYTLTADQKSIQSAAVQYRGNANQTWSQWKTKTTSFDAQGRITSETLAWSPGVTVPTGSVASSTGTNTYSFDAAQHSYSIAASDGLGNTTTTTMDVGVVHGPTTQVKLPLGQTITSQYDAIGRIILSVDALGNRTTTSYTTGASGNTVTATGPIGYLVRQSFDAMGRLSAVQDNGDPTQSGGTVPNRTLRSYVYNALGQTVQATDELGLSNAYQFDGLGRVIEQTDPLGNQNNTVYNDGQLSSQELLNHVLQSQSTLDGFGRVISVTTYADPGDTSIQYARRLDSSFDGFGLLRTKSLYTVPPSPGNPGLLQQANFDFDVEAMLSSEHLQGQLGSTVTIARTRQYELFGNAVMNTKTTTYDADERTYTNRSESSFYDAAGQLIKTVNALDQNETYTYDGNGRLSQRTRLDGTTFSHQYDANGQLTQLSWPGGAITYTYLTNGRTASIAGVSGTMQFTYALDGSATAITYPDGSRQTYTLDAYSRVVAATDAAGIATQTVFDQYGRLASRQHGPDTLSYQYGTVNHGFGLYVGDTLSGSTSLTRQLNFGGFGQVSKVEMCNGAGQSMLASSYARDALGRITQIAMSSQTSDAPAVNLTRQAAYDGLNQLASSLTTYAGSQPTDALTYVYDGNYNVLECTSNGTTRDYSYNAIDQITSGGVEYDINGRMTADGSGASYSYNELDQLTAAVAAAGASVSYGYHPDGAMAQRNFAGAALRFYYGSGSINAVAAQAAGASASATNWTTFLLDTSLRRSAYETGSASYYVAGDDSSSLLLSEGGSATISYDPYGAAVGDANFGADKNFTWNQEYTDPATGLVYLRSRNYHPQLMRFCTMDSLQLSNRYAYCQGNPLNLLDPNGHMSGDEIAGLVVGALVGIVVTVATGGAAGAAAAAIFGTECVAASVGAAALAGAAGAVAGDATNAGISHQQFTGERALVDILSGAAGGAVGAGAGGAAGRWAMSAALAQNMSQRAITNIGLVCSGLVGGVAGSAAAAGVTSAMTGTPFFSAGTAISLAAGAAAGVGGGFLTSGAYLGKMSAKLIPVPLTDADVHLIVQARDTVGANLNERLFVMAPQAEADSSAARFQQMPGGFRSAQTLDYQAGSQTYDTIAAHGAGNTMFASVRYLPEANTDGMPNYARPIKGSVLARYLQANPELIGGTGATNPNPIKLMTCFGAFSNAQTIADALQRPVFAGYPEIDRFSFTNWKTFNPR